MKFPLSADDARTLMQKHGSPLYVYDAEMIRERCRALKTAFPTMRLYYACKANTNAEVVRIIAAEGLDIETVSPGEISAASAAGVPISRIAFTCSSVSAEELRAIIASGVRVHLDSLEQVRVVGEHFPNSEISVRLNLGVGAGHHAHTVTGGSDSKFGIHKDHIPQLRELCSQHGLRIAGVHQHIGSGSLRSEDVLQGVDALLESAREFQELSHIDFGGGFGVPYAPSEVPLPLEELGEAMRSRMKTFSEAYGRFVEMSFEPGRYVVAEAGALLVTVTDVKKNPERTFVGVDSGMGHLIRPMMYDSHHEIMNLTVPDNPIERVTIAGNYCESGDVFAKDRPLPLTQVGDILMVKTAGAYGFVMSSDYNLRPRPKEVVLT